MRYSQPVDGGEDSFRMLDLFMSMLLLRLRCRRGAGGLLLPFLRGLFRRLGLLPRLGFSWRRIVLRDLDRGKVVAFFSQDGDDLSDGDFGGPGLDLQRV
jgi:hypothetical protein